MHEIVENIIIMLLTILVLIAGGYLVLVLLNWGLKLKGGAREDEGLTELWTQAQKDKQSAGSPDASANDDPP